LAGGVSLWRIARMPILIALATAFLSFFVQEHYGVQAVENHGVITKKYFSKLSGQERVGASWTNLADGWTCHILKYNLRANSGQDVYMHAIRENTLEEIRANRIYWDEDRQCWLLENGRWSTFDKDKQWEVLTRRITQVEAPFKESPAELFALSKPAQTKTAEELARDIVRAEQLGMPTREYIVNYHVKFAQPALCFVIIWLGIPFAMRLRRGGVLIGFGGSVIIAVCYLMVFAFAVGLGYMGVWPPLVAAWAANVAFLVVGVPLFWLTPT
ncbi:MAG: YjgP/YjgQ family permease, partial [Candidatus Hydrogenedentes bacterium]|nr:YjgP/YjgQ family permease [Candidatus Hydrogenedentota bacterium]